MANLKWVYKIVRSEVIAASSFKFDALCLQEATEYVEAFFERSCGEPSRTIAKACSQPTGSSNKRI